MPLILWLVLSFLFTVFAQTPQQPLQVPTTVTRIIDGNTIEVGLPPPNDKIRLIGIDTTETEPPLRQKYFRRFGQPMILYRYTHYHPESAITRDNPSPQAQARVLLS